jgi:hypothetical protein
MKVSSNGSCLFTIDVEGGRRGSPHHHRRSDAPTPDRTDDIVEPDGAEFKLPLPLLWQHDSRQPIGHVTRTKVTSDGIEIQARIELPSRAR